MALDPDKFRQPVDKDEFQKLKELPKGTAWPARYEQIKKALPQAEKFDWKKAFDRDQYLYAALMKAMLGLEAPRSHTWGPRPLPSEQDARERLRQWEGEDHTTMPFREAFAHMARGYSERQLVRKLGFNKQMVHRLLSGDKDPDAYTMEVISKAFHKEPGYWLEDRILFIVNVMISRMVDYAPESSISFYRKLRHAEKDL